MVRGRRGRLRTDRGTGSLIGADTELSEPSPVQSGDYIGCKLWAHLVSDVDRPENNYSAPAADERWGRDDPTEYRPREGLAVVGGGDLVEGGSVGIAERHSQVKRPTNGGVMLGLSLCPDDGEQGGRQFPAQVGVVGVAQHGGLGGRRVC